MINHKVSIVVIMLGISISLSAQKNGDSLTIASWNIQMLPKVYQPFTKLTRKKQNIRAPKIIQYLNAAEFDLIVLQEVFDRSIQKEIAKGLIVNYPYQQMPIKEGFTWKLSSGVMILSKHPIKFLKNVIFNTSKKSDKAAQKSCVLVQVEIGSKALLLGGTHLDSKSQESRYQQYEMTKSEILNPYLNDSIPLYLAGDFNTSNNHEDYKKMTHEFGLTSFSLDDDRPYTYDEYNTWNESGVRSWIDFIFYNENPYHQPFKQYILRPTLSFKGSKMDMADHYQIVLETVIY